MAKKSLTLNGFLGGINKDADASDIISEGSDLDEVVSSQNIFLDYKGKIVAEHPDIKSQTGVISFSNGDATSTISGTSYATLTGGSAGDWAGQKGTFTDGWADDDSSIPITQTATSGEGTGLLVQVRSSSGETTMTILQCGSGYADGELITFTDPGATINAVQLVANIGLAGSSGGQDWLTTGSSNDSTAERVLVYDNILHQNTGIYKMGEAITYSGDSEYILNTPTTGVFNNPVANDQHDGVDIKISGGRDDAINLFLGKTALDNDLGQGMIMDETSLGGKGGHLSDPTDYILYAIQKDISSNGFGQSWAWWNQASPNHSSSSQVGYRLLGGNYAHRWKMPGSGHTFSAAVTVCNSDPVTDPDKTNFIDLGQSSGEINAQPSGSNNSSNATDDGVANNPGIDYEYHQTGSNNAWPVSNTPRDVTEADTICFWRANDWAKQTGSALTEGSLDGGAAGSSQDGDGYKTWAHGTAEWVGSSSAVYFRTGATRMDNDTAPDSSMQGKYGKYVDITNRDIALEVHISYGANVYDLDSIWVCAYGRATSEWNENFNMGNTNNDHRFSYAGTPRSKYIKVWQISRTRLLDLKADEDFVKVITSHSSAVYEGENFDSKGVKWIALGYTFLDDTDIYHSNYIPVLQVKEFSFLKSGTFGWGGSDWKMYQTFKQHKHESLLRAYEATWAGQDSNLTLTVYKPNATIGTSSGGNIYIQQLDDSGVNVGDPYKLAEWSYEDGVKSVKDDFYTPWDTSSNSQKAVFNTVPLRSTYTFESGVPIDTTSLNALYKTSAVVGRQVYIGNCAVEKAQKCITTDGDYQLESNLIDPSETLTVHRTSKYITRTLGSWTNATAIIKFTSVAAVGETIKITSTDGTTKTYTAAASETTANNEFNVATSAAANITSLVACINASDGHQGKIQVYDDTSGTAYLTQVVAGEAGNSNIVNKVANAVHRNFREGDTAFSVGDQVITQGLPSSLDGTYVIASFATVNMTNDKMVFTTNLNGSSSGTITVGDDPSEELVRLHAFEGSYDGSLILKSMIGKAAGFSNEQFIDLEFGGDTINVMESSGDRLLVFSTMKLSIINVAQDVEFMDATFDYYGVDKHRQVCKVGEGVAWINQSGVFFFDGQQVVILTDKKLSTLAITNDECAIGYDAGRNLLWCWVDKNDIYFYSFTTSSWAGHINHSTGYAGAYNGDSLPDTNIVGGPYGYSFYEKNHSTVSSIQYLGTSRADAKYDRTGVLFQTGKISLGNIGRRKKFYKLYITALNAQHVKVLIRTDESPSTFTEVFTGILSAGENAISLTSSGLLSSSSVGKYLEIKITEQNSSTHPVMSDMEIGDITIIYREKGLK